MADYTITFARSALKELEALDAAVVKRILSKVEALALEPKPRGCGKLHGEESLWRIRVGDYRVVYAIYHEEQIVGFMRCDIAATPMNRGGAGRRV